MHKALSFFVLISCFGWGLWGCAAPVSGLPEGEKGEQIPNTQVPTPTDQPTFTPIPTRTPTPFMPLEPTPTQPSTPTPLPSPTPIPVITMMFTGQIVPARCVQAGIDLVGSPDYVYANILDLLTSADLTIGALNASLSEISPATGCIETFVLAGRSENADAMARAGFDLMSVATNHIKNCNFNSCGDQAFLATLDNLRRVNVLPVGAGANLAEALLPVVIEVKGIKFGFVSLGQIEQNAFASETRPGIAVLNEANLHAAIQAARSISDYVIVLPHWGPEYTVTPNYLQQALAQAAVDAGADLVVGNHTHVIQTYTEINGIKVFYGLGNFVFDQDWSAETTQSVLLNITFEGTRLVDYELIPVVSSGIGEVTLAPEPLAAEILARIQSAP